MEFNPLCWIWKEELPETICDEIVKLCEQRELITATVEDGDVRPAIRVTEVSFVDPDINRLWLEAVCRTYIEAGNVWGIQLSELRAPQYAVYEKDSFYGYHVDTDKVSENGTQRKLSMSIQLSHPWEYEGGELQFAPWGASGTPEHEKNVTFEDFLPRGSIIVFPSTTPHQVTRITRGTRKSLVVWCAGPPWS